MKADSLSIAKVFSSGGDIHYVLPYFQREYTWDPDQWKTLLNDGLAVCAEIPEDQAETTANIEHFLGSVVVIFDGMRGGTVSALKLVDGQQRLTTISLLLKALGALIETSHANLSRKIDKFLVNTDEQGDLFFKILPTTKAGDRSAYCALIKGEDTPEGNYSKVIQAYSFFKRELQSRLDEGLEPEKFLQVILNSFQVVFVNLDRNESPYRIFESLNAKGKPLTQGDLVRNYIAMKLPADSQERVFTQSWSRVENLLRESRKVGRLTELTAFLRHYLAMHSGVLCDEGHIYARFRDRIEKEFAADGALEQELKRIAVFAAHYDRLLRPTGFAETDISTAMTRLNALEISTGYPFLLRACDAFSNGTLSIVSFLGTLAVLENYMVRRYITREPVNFLVRLFPGLWAQVDLTNIVESLSAILGAQHYPSDAKVRRALKERQLYDSSELTRRRTTLILESLNRELSTGTGGLTILDGSPTIEHVMPQSLGEEWKHALGVMWEQVHKDYLHTLGNLTLMTGDWNSSLSNAPFSAKQAKLANHALRLNSDYFDGSLLKWTRDEILERAESLGSTLLKVWPALVPDAAVPFPEQPPELESAEFHFAAVERVSESIGSPLRRISKARFESADGQRAVVGMCSRLYEGAEGVDAQFWFGFRVSQREFLRQHAEGWVAFECDVPDRVVLLPAEKLEPFLRHLNVTEGSHWHIVLMQVGGQMWLHLPLDQRREDVTHYLLPFVQP
ncbi:MAG: hypothetical protein JW395_2611 [Nitrospira sp.]|nr:hypothetical protein [Nitrospira sp.]